MTAAQRERSALVDTLRIVGPDAPTLCAGWTTRDLAAHLVVRERRLDATPGISIPFLAGYTAKVQNQTARSSSWDDLVEMVASGPPVYSPFKLLDSVANLGEMFIHHEDVRRAVDGWQPRVLDELDRRCAGSAARSAEPLDADEATCSGHPADNRGPTDCQGRPGRCRHSYRRTAGIGVVRRGPRCCARRIRRRPAGRRSRASGAPRPVISFRRLNHLQHRIGVSGFGGRVAISTDTPLANTLSEVRLQASAIVRAVPRRT